MILNVLSMKRAQNYLATETNSKTLGKETKMFVDEYKQFQLEDYWLSS